MSIPNRTARHRLLALVTALALGVSACGADEETVDAGAPSDDTTPAETLPEGDDMTTEPDDQTTDDQTTDGYTPTTPRTDLVSLQPATPDEVVVDPTDDSQLLIHFTGAAEPCSGAAVTVTETDSDVTVVLETGLDPNAAAMSCIAQVFDYEIVVPLEAPLADRTIAIG